MDRMLVSIALSLALAAVSLAQVARPTAAATAPTTRNPAIADEGDPVFTLCDDGVYLLGTGPRVLFAAWADGTIVREVGHRTRPGPILHDATGRTIGQRTITDQDLRIGHVAPADVKRLLEEADAAGVEGLQRTGSVSADGPSQTMLIRRGGKVIARTQDPGVTSDDVCRDGRPADPNRDGYVDLWRRTSAEIAALRPADERPIDGPLGLLPSPPDGP